MRSREGRRGVKVPGGADLEGVEPGKFSLERADGLDPPAGNTRYRAAATGARTPLGPRPCQAGHREYAVTEEVRDPVRWERAPVNKRKGEDTGGGARKSEPLRVVSIPHNAGGAKGWRF